MLKLPQEDICIESPKQNEYVNTVSNEKQSDNILGHGSYGRVYKAIYRDQPVAVKIVRKINMVAAESVTRESNILGWSHENIIKTLKITTLDDCFTIIMERHPGICLQQLLNRMKLPLWHRLKISTDIISGLRFCHQRNLAHLDVKPQNVFVAFVANSSIVSQTNYTCKLFDFGCSTSIDEVCSNSNQRGTIRYMSPDILQGFTIGLHDDIYSLGITMWQLKSNADPYYNIPSNEYVAYHVVKNNLRPDLQLKCYGTKGKENENSVTVQAVGVNGNGSGNKNGFDCHLRETKQVRKLLTPRPPNNERIPSDMQFLSTGHNRRPLNVITATSSNIVKRLDFNSVSEVNRISLSPRLVNTKKNEKHKSRKEKTCDTSDTATFFKDFYQHLSTDRKIKIENSYENIYKQCWEQEAVKRPSSDVVLELLNSTFYLFD